MARITRGGKGRCTLSRPTNARREAHAKKRAAKQREARAVACRSRRSYVLPIENGSKLLFGLIQRAAELAQPISSDLARVIAPLGTLPVDLNELKRGLRVATEEALRICPYGDARLRSPRASAHAAITMGFMALVGILCAQTSQHESEHLGYSSHALKATIEYLVAASPEPIGERALIDSQFAAVSIGTPNAEQMQTWDLTMRAMLDVCAPNLVNSRQVGLA